MKKIYFNPKKCLSCRSCEFACAIGHSAARDLFAALKEEIKTLPSVKITGAKGKAYALRCRHCEDPKCVEACMSACLSYDQKTKQVVHNKEKCVGCWMCVMVCPYGAIRPNAYTKTPVRCDLCADEDIPRCVLACPTKALMFCEEAEFEKSVKH
ncbi:MAG: 4Fe-4S dicluster domain-containing protein [Candidatus Omnitrophota bacterium]